MQAQQHLDTIERQQAVMIARRLIDANTLYNESNDGSLSVTRRNECRIEVRDLLQDVLQTQPTQPDALNLLGRVELDDGNMESAREMFSLALEVNPDAAQTLINMGYWALGVSDADEALACFERALEQDRQSAAAFAGVAHARRMRGEFDTAYLHYRRLLDLDVTWPSVYTGMLTCAEYLTIDEPSAELVEDAIRLLRRDDLPHQNLARFVSALLREQYGLDYGGNQWLLDAAADDELLLLALERSILPDPKVEKIITHIRAALAMEVQETGELRESLQPLALALAVYAERVGYALIVSAPEEVFVQNLDNALMQTLATQGVSVDLAGALILRGLYGSLFHTPYASHIGAAELIDWPRGMRPMMAASYYDKAQDESYKQNFAEKQDELALAKEDVSHAWPSWSNLTPFTPQRLRDELEQSLGIANESWPDTLRVLVIGAGSGQRAIEMAHYFTDVEVVAVDEDLANLAHGARRANNRGLQNIVFWPYSLATRFINDGHKVQMVEICDLPSARLQNQSINELVQTALDTGGVLHINTNTFSTAKVDLAIRRLVERHKLPPTTQTLRRLRRMVLNNPDQEPWTDLLRDPDFYATAGCRKRWFFPEDPAQISQVLKTLASEVDWKLMRARDEDGQDLATTPVRRQLQAQREGSRVRGLSEHGLSLYFQRRR